MISSCSENSQHPWRSHFNIEFSWQYNFSGKNAFKIVSYFSAHYQRNGLFSIKINAIQNQWISFNVIGHPQARRLFLLHLFVVLSSLSSYFKLTIACYWLLLFLQLRRHRRFWLTNLLLQRSASVIIIQGSFCELQSEAEWYYKVAQWASDVLWTSNGRLYEVRTSRRRPLDIQKTSYTHWEGRYYKVG